MPEYIRMIVILSIVLTFENLFIAGLEFMRKNLIILVFLCFSSYALNTKSESTPTISEHFSPAAGVNKYTGDAAFSHSLFQYENLNLAINYSSNVYMNVRSRNDKGSTGWCGLGWQFGFGSISCNHKGTKTVMDDEYYWISPTGTSCKILKKNGVYYLKDSPYWKIEMVDNGNDNIVEGWIITSIDGSRFKYGNLSLTPLRNSTRYTLYWPALNDQNDPNYLKLGYVGDGFNGNPSPYPYQWDLAEIEDAYGNKVEFEYDNILSVVNGNWTLNSVSYTKESYLKWIRFSDGTKVLIETDKKKPKEYYDPMQAIEEPDALQEFYEENYLDRIIIYNQDENIIKRFKFCYQLINNNVDGNFAKRLLSSIIELKNNGEKKETIRFVYNNDELKADIGNYFYGALDSIIFPSCGKIKYDYVFKNVSVDLSGQVMGKHLGKNPSIKMGTIDNNEYMLALDENKNLWVFRWNGSKWESDYNNTNTFGVGKINDFAAGHNFFVFSFNGGNRAIVMKWNGMCWKKAAFDYDNNGNKFWPSSYKLQAYNDFFVAYEGKGNNSAYLYTITDAKISENQIYTKELNSPENFEIGVAFNTVTVQVRYGAREIWKFSIWKRTGEDTWNKFLLNENFFPHDDVHHAYLRLGGNGNFFNIWYEPLATDFIYYFNWDGKEWNELGREVINGNGTASVHAGTDYTVIRHDGREHLTIMDWDGKTWRKKIDKEKVTSTKEFNVNVGNQFVTLTYPNWGRKFLIFPKVYDNERVRVYHKNGDIWRNKLLGDIGFKKREKSLFNGSNFFVAHIKSSGGDAVAYSWNSWNSWDKSFGPVDITDDLGGSVTEITSVGGTENAFALAARKLSGVDGTSINGEKIKYFRKSQDRFDKPGTYVVFKRTVIDPVENREMATFFSFDSANFESNYGIAKYQKVTEELKDNDGKSIGKTVTYFYNDNCFVDKKPLTASEKEFDGLIKKVNILDSKNPSEIKSTTINEYEMYSNASWPESSNHKRFKKSESITDGIKKISEILKYDENNGLPTTVRSTINSNAILDSTLFAYLKYPAMGKSADGKHMLSQSCENIRFEGVTINKNNIINSAVTTWSNTAGASNWVPCSTFVWKDDLDENGKILPNSFIDFNFTDPKSNANNNKWRFNGCTKLYSENGMPIENHNALNSSIVTVYGYDGKLPIATISNSSQQECAVFTGDYEDKFNSNPDYFDFTNSWKKGNSSLSNIKTNFGSKSVLIESSDAGPSKDVLLGDKIYSFSCWAYSDVNTRVKLKLISNGVEINSFAANKLIEAGKWQFIERIVTEEDVKNKTITIQVCSDGENIYVDDIRFAPRNSFISTRYYDPLWKSIIAEVDPNNKVSYVEYDEVGRPVKWRNNAKQVTQERQYSFMKCYTNGDDATLKSLSVSEGDIEFDPNQFNYEITVQNTVNEIEIIPVVNHPDAVLIINGSIEYCPCGNPYRINNLAEGVTTVTIKVISADGSKNNTYNILINRLRNCWAIAGNRKISEGKVLETSLSHSTDNVLYLAYINENDKKKIILKKFIIDNWVLVNNIESVGEVSNISLCVVGTVPYISYLESIENNNFIRVKKLEGVSWVNAQSEKFIDNRGFGNVELKNFNSEIYLSYVFEIENSNYPYTPIYGLRVKKLNDGFWQNVGSDVSNESASNVRLIITNSGKVYIGYIHQNSNEDNDDDEGKIIVKKLVENNWQKISEICEETSIKFDLTSGGEDLYVVFSTDINEVISKKYNANSNTWAVLGIQNPLFYGSNHFVISCNEGVPYIAFANDHNHDYMSVIKYSSYENKWVPFGNPAFVKTTQNGSCTKMQFVNGIPYLVIQDYYNKYSAMAMVYESTCPNATLNTFRFLEGNLLVPDFRSYIVYYDVKVNPSINNITAQATTDDGNKIKINHVYTNNLQISVPTGTIPFETVVEGNDSKTITKYVFTVNKQSSEFASLCEFIVKDKNNTDLMYTPAFQSNIFKYNLDVEYVTDKIMINARANDGASVKINEQYATGNDEVILDVGYNLIKIDVIAADGQSTVKYGLEIIRKANNDLSFYYLGFNDNVGLYPGFNSSSRNVFKYETRVIFSTSQVTLNASYPVNSKLIINGSEAYSGTIIPLNTGVNDIIISLNQPINNVTANYLVKIIRNPSFETGLLNLEIKDDKNRVINLTPTISPYNLNYSCSVSEDVSEIELTPTPQDNSAKIKINDEYLTGGKSYLFLRPGKNYAEIEISKADDTQNTKYYLVINKEIETIIPKISFESGLRESKEKDGKIEIGVLLDRANFQNSYCDFEVTNITTNNNDYNIISSGRLEFSACDEKKYIEINILQDQLVEENEKFKLTLKNPVNVNLGNAECIYTIVDDDHFNIEFVEANKSIIESNTTINVPVSIDRLIQAEEKDAEIDYKVIPINGANENDFVLANGKLVWSYCSNSPCDLVKYIPLLLKDDTRVDPNKGVRIVLQNPVNAKTGTRYEYVLSIIDDDMKIEFENADLTYKESETPQVKVKLSTSPGTTPYKIDYTITGGTADKDIDYTLTNGSITFNNTNTAIIPLTFINDRVYESDHGDETILLTLSNPDNGAILGNQINCTIKIKDDDVVLWVREAVATPGNPNDVNAGRNWNSAFKYLQDALSVARIPANNIVEIRVAKGHYYPDQYYSTGSDGNDGQAESFELINGVILIGGYNESDNGASRDASYQNNETYLDGNVDVEDVDDGKYGNSYHVLQGNNVSCTIDGFTIQNGNAASCGINEMDGSGMLIVESSIIILNSNFNSNEVKRYGGAIYQNGGELSLIKCKFDKNKSVDVADIDIQHGGAVYVNINGYTSLYESVFSQNSSDGDGGAIYSEGNLTVVNSEFDKNISGVNGGAIYGNSLNDGYLGIYNNSKFNENHALFGGAIYCGAGAGPTISEAIFTNNTAGIHGGAIYHDEPSNESDGIVIISSYFFKNNCEFYGGAVNLTNNNNYNYILNSYFIDNSADFGGAVYLDCGNEGGLSVYSNCLFLANNSDNYGGAIYNEGKQEYRIHNCTFTKNIVPENSGVIFSVNSNICNIKNSILWNNQGNDILDVYENVSVSYCDIEQNWSNGTHNIHVDPLFCKDPVVATDCKLQQNSECINRGLNDISIEDIERNPKIGVRDIGAYEFIAPCP